MQLEYNCGPVRCKALRMSLNLTIDDLAHYIFVNYAKSHDVDLKNCINAQNAVAEVIEAYENARTGHELYDVYTRIANQAYEVTESIEGCLLKIRNDKVEEYGEWYKQIIFLSYFTNKVSVYDYDAEYQKKAYDELCSWMNQTSFLKYSRKINDDAFGVIELFNKGDEKT